MDSFYIPPGSVAAPVAPNGSIGTPVANDGTKWQWSSNGTSPRPLVNMAKDWHPAVAAPTVPVPVSGAHAAHKPRIVSMVAMGGVVVLAAAGGGYIWLSQKPAPKSPAVAVTTPTPSPSPSPTPTSTPTPSPTPSPTPTPPTVVTQPAANPTPSHPQAVTVKAPSGLWLRSSPTSVDRSNIIGWMPDGASVSVDSVGSFWWHGTYNGKAGYFAVNYTNQ